MRKNYIFLLTAASVLLLSGCLKEEELDGNKPLDLEPMTFFAEMESGADTKTMIEGNVGDAVRYLKWLPEDKIGVYNAESNKFETFVNVNEEASSTAVFEGVNSVQDVYYAVYPYSESHSYAKRDMIMTVDLPAVQKYSTGSFGLDANPMVALAGQGEKFFFQNLCGVLVINITGDVSVKSISVTLLDESGNLAPVSGKHTVSMDYIESPSLAFTEESQKSVTLDCGDGVALNASEPTPFHVVLPAGTYSGITVSVLTTDGGIMVKHGKNSLRIRRSRVTSAGEFHHQSEIAVDLSERGTANCYVVSDPGVYSFDATVIGNGEFGLVPGAGFHTDNPEINPTSVELLWEDASGVVQSVFYKDGRIGFYSSGIEGNALLAAKDASGTIVWSWHIWVTDKPTDHIYINDFGTFTVQDRNLGATRNDRGDGDQWKHSVGAYYQWGRKDPMMPAHYTVVKESVSIKESNAAPSTFFYSGFTWMQEENTSLWSPEFKSVYDPCPVGYRIATQNIWSSFSVSGDNDKGLYFKYDGDGGTSWYPASSWIDTNGNLVNQDYQSYVWAAEYKENLHFSQNTLELTGIYVPSNGFNVRCMKDEGYVDVSLPQVQIAGFDEITSSSVIVFVNIKSEGISPVTEKGVIYGTTSDLIDGIKVECNEENIVELTGLTSSVKYFVKPYALNGRGESYGPVKSLTTRYSDEIVNLSSMSTANCYIVPPLSLTKYSFDCSVKGNSLESIGPLCSLEVLWEVDGCSSTAESGTIISSVEIVDNELAIFELPDDVQEGNALIAAKDQSGTILWSWHIWVTDKPEEHSYMNSKGTYTLLDRNIGASSASRGIDDEWEDSVGLLYQWGRKDPFFKDIFSTSTDIRTIDASVQSPVCHARLTAWNQYYHWVNNDNKKLWLPDQKTIYDPCPPGYTTADINAYYGVSADYDYDKGYYVKFNESVTSWFPITPLIHCAGEYNEASGDVIIWSSSTTSSSFCRLHIINDDEKEYWGGYDNAAMASPVRCMKE